MATPDIMLDIETLSVQSDAVVLTIGAIKFNPYSDELGDSFYQRLEVDEQILLGRHVDDGPGGTVEWWGRQAEDVREEALGDGADRVSLDVFTNGLNKFLVGNKLIWTQGPHFDITILESLYKQIGKPCPWNFWEIRDTRTAFGLLGDPRDKNAKGAHNALEDCISQATSLQSAIKKHGLTKP